MSWPTAEASRVELLVPNELITKGAIARGANASGVCFLSYDPNERLLSIVQKDDSGNDIVLDVIDPDDMIGARVEIQLRNEEETTSNTDSPPANHNNDNNNSRDANEPASDQLLDRQGSAVLTLFTYPRKDLSSSSSWLSCSHNNHHIPNPNYTRPTEPWATHGKRFALLRSFTVAPAEDLQDLRVTAKALQELAGSVNSKDRPAHHYLILVNPVSGPHKHGERVARDTVVPMLEQAGIDCDTIITQHAGHAKEIMLERAVVSKYDGIVLIGGDGIIHEVLQGIKQRDQSLLQKWKIGVVGCGTSNGFAVSIAHQTRDHYGPLEEAFRICKGDSMSVDLAHYETTSQSYLGFMTFSWAMIADIDIESEVLRFLGETRYDVWGVWRVLTLRKYRARLSYWPSSRDALDSLPPLSQNLGDGWETIEDDFCLFWASQVTHAGMSQLHSPRSNMKDGVFQLLIVRGSISRFRMTLILLGLENGSHENMPGVEWVECTAFRLEPTTDGSFNDLDGEVVESGPMQARIMPSALRVFSGKSN